MPLNAQSPIRQDVLPPETILMPELLSNRRLDYLSDATSVGWNPALLGVRPQFDLALSSAISGNSLAGSQIGYSMKLGAFLKMFGFGLGYAGNPNVRSSGGQLYVGYGFPVLDDALWAGASARLSFTQGTFFDYNASLLWKPLHGLLLSASATTMAMDTYSPEQNYLFRRAAPGMVQIVGHALYSLNNEWTLLATARSASLQTPSQPSFEAGISANLLDATIILSGYVQLPQPAFRVGIEVNSDFMNVLYNVAVRESRQPEHHILLRFSNDKVHSIGQIRTSRADAQSELCSSKSSMAFEDPAVFLSALPKLNPLLEEVFSENGMAKDSARFYSALRKQFYGRRIKTSAEDTKDLTLSSTKGYGLEFKRQDVSLYPLQTTILRVADSLGRPQQGLGTNDFASLDTARRILSVRRIDTSTAVPIDIVLLLDCSASMKSVLTEVRDNTEYFLDELRRNGVDARVGVILYGMDILDVLQPTERLDRVSEFLARAVATQNNEYTPGAIDELVGMKFRPEAERIGILMTDELMYSNRKPALRELLTLRELWEKRISLHKVVLPCANNGVASAYLTLGREYHLREPFVDIVGQIGREASTLYAVTTVPKATTLSFIAGTIRTENGQPVQATITLSDGDFNTIGPFQTLVDGSFVQAIPEGRKYRLFVKPLQNKELGIVLRTLDATRLTKGDTLRQDILLLKQTILKGNVRDERGTPIQADIFLQDNLGYEFPTAFTQKNSAGIETGNYEVVIVPGRKYRVRAVPVRSTLFEPLEYELDARNFRSGDTLEQTFTLPKVQPFVLVEGSIKLKKDIAAESLSPALNLGGIRVVVRNQANQEIIQTTETNTDGVYTFRLPKGLSAEVLIEAANNYAPSRWRAFFRKADTISVARVTTTLTPKGQSQEEDIRAAKEGIENIIVQSRSLAKRQVVLSTDAAKATTPLAQEETVLETAPPKNVRMPETMPLLLSFADAKAILPIAMDSSGMLMKRPWEEVVQQLAANIKKDASRLAKVVIIGHTDETASEEANQAEGWQRAEFILKELVKRGIPATLVTATSQGNKQLLPRKPKESDFNYRARCRRVEVMKIWKAE